MTLYSFVSHLRDQNKRLFFMAIDMSVAPLSLLLTLFLLQSLATMVQQPVALLTLLVFFCALLCEHRKCSWPASA